MYVYFPSCNFQRLFPDAAARLRAYLDTQPDVRVVGCCHKDNQVPQEGDVIVTVCMSCMRGLAEMRADLPQISLFELLLTRADLPWPDLGGEEITLQDCFRARGQHALQDAARECLGRMNANVVEMPRNRDEETYDGSFLYHEPYPQNLREAPRYYGEYLPGHITPVPQEEWPRLYREHAALYTTPRVACYCNVCTTSAREGGADALHLAELIFPA